MHWFKAHPVGSLWIVWLGGSALLAGIITAIVILEVYEGGLTWAGQWMIIVLSVGYLATLMKVCYWVLEEKAQDRSVIWAFFIGIVGGIFPIIVALFGRDNTIVDRTYVPGKKAESAVDLEVRSAVEREERLPLDVDQTSERAQRLSEEHFKRALEYENVGDYNKAISEYTSAIELYGSYGAAYFNRGALLMQQGKKVRARPDFLKVISLSPGTDLADMAKRAVERDRA